MEEVIRRFLAIGYGYGGGYGDGYGNGYGYGSGDGNGGGYGGGNAYGGGNGGGYGYGYGSGDGCGDGGDGGEGGSYGDGYGNGGGYGGGNGCGEGYGYGLQSFNGHTVYMVDGVQTLIYSVKGNIAKGAIVNTDLTLTDCYIARVDDSFAHGETIHQAMDDATNKALQELPTEGRIRKVVAQYPDPDAPIEHSTLFSLHNMLTGSCVMGRKEFAKAHDLDPENGSMTMREFITLTKDAFGGEVIRKLAEAYGIKL